MSRKTLLGVAALVVLFACSGVAQTESPKPAPPRPLSPTARLTSAKTVYMKNAGGSDVPFNVIVSGVQGWGRYHLVSSPEKADLVVEVTSPSGGGVTVSSTTTTDPQSGYPSQSVTSSRELNVSRITLIVYDAKSKMALWSASEQPKGALRDKTRQDNVVDAAQRLLRKFHERVEPETK